MSADRAGRGRSRPGWLAPAALCLLAPAIALAQSGAEPRAATPAGRCGTCHPAERVLFEKSRHAQEAVRCTACHGGNDQTVVLGAAHGAGFRGRPSRRDIPALCASCHANEERMRAYNLPVDQYALYQTSGHGRRLARGDLRVAVCSDCHGAHDILPPSDPASRVFDLNVPRTCGTCHGDSTIVGAKGGRNTLRDYLSSVHAHALLDKGNRGSPTCVSCHGVHGAAPPAVGDVDKVCGRCHTAERRYFMAGPHREGLLRAGQPECASCHGDHAIEGARPERLSTMCAQCHGEGSPQESLGTRLATDYGAASRGIDRAAGLIERADAIPIATDDYRARLEEARTYLREALPAAHSLQVETVEGFLVRAGSVSAEIEHEINAKLGNLRTRKYVLVVFWFYVLVTILVLRRFRDRGAPGV